MDRRSFLGTTGSAGLAALTGCSGILGDGESSEGGDGGGSEGGVEATTRWAVPAAAPNESLAGYELRSARPTEIRQAHDGVTADAVAGRLADRSLVQRHLDVREVDHFVEVGPVGHPPLETYVVYEGEFDADAAIESLGEDESVDVERVGERGAYEIFDSGPGFAAHAVADGTIVEADRLRNDELAPADVEAIVDAAGGDSDRIADQHDGLNATADRLSQPHHLGLRIEDPEQSTDTGRSRFAGAVASGDAAEIDGEQTELRNVVTFESEQAREAAPIDRWLEEARTWAPSAELSETIDGRFVETTATIPTAEFYG